MERKIQVIVSPCMKTDTGYRALTMMFRAEVTADFMDDAQRVADMLMRPGHVVIIRPVYNETDEHGQRYFREWRSFDGQPFEEVRWDF